MDKLKMIEKIEKILELPILKSLSYMGYSDVKIMYDKLIEYDKMLDQLQKRIDSIKNKLAKGQINTGEK